MKQINELHKRAMDAADRADAARRAGSDAEAMLFFREAFSAEREAALLVPTDLEPTRSVLLRSAASLAIECGDLREAERLVGMALSSDGPEEIREEIRDLYETIKAARTTKSFPVVSALPESPANAPA